MSWFTRQRVIYLVLAVALAGVGWRASAGSSGPADVPPDQVEIHTYASPPPPPPAPVVVYVVGMVRHPGVYRLRSTSRLQAAVRAAGGARPGADLQAINLAAPIADGQQIVVPARGAAPASAAGGGAPTADAPVSLSTATASQLEELDGIGPTLAARIVEWRTGHGPFTSVDQLGDVPGIGDARLDALRDRVVP